jgi:hypothetical protein
MVAHAPMDKTMRSGIFNAVRAGVLQTGQSLELRQLWDIRQPDASREYC